MFTPTVLLCAALAAAPPADTPMSITATIEGDRLEVGRPASIELRIEIADAWSSAAAGIPRPLVQIGVPSSVTLEGDVLTGRALMRNEFLQAPFERAVAPGTTTIGFTLDRSPEEHERIAINVVAYLAKDAAAEGDDPEVRFVRRRVELPVRAGATATATTMAERSSYDAGGTLQIGDRVPPLELPRADGSTVALADALADGPVVVTTYRAFW